MGLDETVSTELPEMDERTCASGRAAALRATIWQTRPDLQALFAEDAEGFSLWLLTHGRAEYRGVAELGPDIAAELFDLAGAPGPPPALPRVLWRLWRDRADLQAAFDLDRTEGRRGLISWFWRHGRAELGLSEPREAARALPAVATGLGVNIIGSARGAFGIGEDVRMATLACMAAEIPFSIYDIAPGREVPEDDCRMAAHIRGDLPHGINLFCMTGIETARTSAVAGQALFAGRTNIGAWPWELPCWPGEWHHAYDLVDEIWASSRYARDAYAKSCPKPVHPMPMAVCTAPSAGHSRADFGLDRGRFCFLFAFDGLSSFARKNPEGCVAAFAHAFPQGDEPVALVLKGMRAAGAPAWNRLASAAAEDPRIRLIDETMPRGAVLDLMRAADAFVSLHRAEGFGRCLAEAMLLGKPVIASAHSGNLDFCKEGAAGLVRCTMREVREGEYPFGGGQCWAEPEIGHAADWMRRFANDPALCRELARRGQELVAAHYGPETVGRQMRARLERLVERRRAG